MTRLIVVSNRVTTPAGKGEETVGGLAKTKLIGHAKLAGQALMGFAAYNLVRMGSIGGWWDAHHV